MHVSPRHAVVVGAGLAGAAVCAALARRGWEITLIDQASGPAQAASALPVGMLSPHVTKAPTPLSRLSALGVAAMRAELERMLPQGHGWQACEVDNLGHDPGRWPAALVRPSALVQAWLSETAAATRLEPHWNTRVSRLVQNPLTGGWTVLDGGHQAIAESRTVVLAAAFGSAEILQVSSSALDQGALPLRPVRGQMSLGPLRNEPTMPRPQRNRGVFVPIYQDIGMHPEWPNRLWCMGSTYRRGENNNRVTHEDHVQNLRSLEALNPLAAQHMEQSMASGELLGWAQVRCASLDRIPLVGALPDVAVLQSRMSQAGPKAGRVPMHETPRWPGLYVLSALGSRGLTLAHWCAELLATQIQGIAPEVEADLLAALDPARFAWRLARRQALRPPASQSP